MKYKKHSGCPFTYALDIFGDKWSLIILRDLILFGKKTYKEFAGSGECIATNILADRLANLEKDGLISKAKNPENRRSYIYSPTRKSLDLVPMFLELVCWSAKYDPKTAVPPVYYRRARNDRKGMIKKIVAEFKSVRK